jgi:3-oxoacyl-[acyl-carrier protein] reductase
MAGTGPLSISLKDRVALITGGGAGIGKGVAEAFAQLGAQVSVLELDGARAARITGILAEYGSAAPVCTGDARSPADVADCLGKIGKAYGRLDILVNNVGDVLMSSAGEGPTRRWPFAETTEDDWDALYQVNLRHVFLVTRAAIPLLRQAAPGSSIINISSIEAFRAIPNHAVYSAFKTAITGFTRTMALELGPYGIRVNAIAPESTETEQARISEWLEAGNEHLLNTWFPLGRHGTPRDAAGCAVFLSSELSAWVTGTTIHLDGGVLAAAGWVRAPDGRWTHRPYVTGVGYG